MSAISDAINSVTGNIEIPNILNDAEIYLDGVRLLGKGEVKLPDIKHKMIGYSALGMAGETDLPVVGHTEKLEGSIKFKAMTKEAGLLLYDPSTAVLLDARASVQRHNPASGKMSQYPIKATMRGFFKEVKSGDWKQGSDNAGECTYTVDFYNLFIDGAEIVMIDKFNYKYIINGKDLLVEVRNNLGR